MVRRVVQEAVGPHQPHVNQQLFCVLVLSCSRTRV
jgi:hypothetical protein